MPPIEPRPYAEIVESLLEAMTAPPSPLSDRAVGSVTRTLAEAFGREIAFMQRQLQQVYLWGFIDTAEGEALDRVVALLGVVRRRQETAAGQVVFSRKPGTAGAITIPGGTRVSTREQPVTFETGAPVELKEDEASGLAHVRAQVAGREGVVKAGAITVMNRPVAGIAGVVNPEATALGAPTETDEQLRERARRTLERAGKATLGAIRYGLMEVPGVRGVAVQDNPAAEPGVVKVMVDLDGDAAPGTPEAVLAALDDLRAAGVRAYHNLPVQNRDYDEGLKVSVVPVRTRCFVTFQSDALPPAEQARALQEVRSALQAYLGGLEVGEHLSLNRMIALAMAVQGVRNVSLEADVPADARRKPEGGQLTAGPAERFTLAEVIVGPVTVFLDVTLTGSVPGGTGLAPDEVRDGVRRSLQTYLEQVRAATRQGPFTLNVGKWLTEALKGGPYSHLNLSISVTTIYAGRGLVLRDLQPADDIALEIWESPQLRNFQAGLTVFARPPREV